MRIKEITTNKKAYIELLLLADEQEDMIDRYLEAGRMFVLEDDGIKSEAVVVTLNEHDCELKNLATDPSAQGRGYGKALIQFLFAEFLGEYQTMYVGTGDVPKTLNFYKSCGFRESHRQQNFFTDNYAEPIIEEGIQLVDMVYLRKDAENAPTEAGSQVFTKKKSF
ncbi:GNAT family N-acetyltransferase [Enterococcus viikkiensis]|uniref:GNAT family N-acetyltransferase n=1 Tax=Enterococcus viikkiensis TaxID=930854 RepID=UPI0010F46C0C|nr:GNAT family N-acetyltransferase [Enterococcus viikkiensis]